MPMLIIRNDITKVKCDAIVNAANETLLGGGGVDGAIHRAAGKKLLEECRALGGCRTGQAKITGGYRLPSRYVIHTVGPVWRGGACHEEELLRSCYRQSMQLAAEHACSSMAFPLISAGAYGYPKEAAVNIAVEEIGRFLQDHDMLIYLVVFDRADFEIGRTLTDDLREYIDQRYVDEHTDRSNRFFGRTGAVPFMSAAVRQKSAPLPQEPSLVSSAAAEECADACSELPDELRNALTQIDESFSEMLLRKIDEKGFTDVQCYKRANIDRKLFSKIRSDRLYKPAKTTVIAFAVSLELPIEETRELLMKAGFALSRSSKFDIIIEYFISRKIYDIFRINEALFSFDQKLLGA